MPARGRAGREGLTSMRSDFAHVTADNHGTTRAERALTARSEMAGRASA